MFAARTFLRVHPLCFSVLLQPLFSSCYHFACPAMTSLLCCLGP
jgi:hypothetical protein